MYAGLQRLPNLLEAGGAGLVIMYRPARSLSSTVRAMQLTINSQQLGLEGKGCWAVHPSRGTLHCLLLAILHRLWMLAHRDPFQLLGALHLFGNYECICVPAVAAFKPNSCAALTVPAKLSPRSMSAFCDDEMDFNRPSFGPSDN